MEAKSQVQSGLPGSCLLVGGQPRSGTTLLSSILRATPRHFQAFELHMRKPSFVVGLDGRYTRNIMKELGLPPEDFDRLVDKADTHGMNLGSWTGPKEDVSAEPLSGNETNDFAGELRARAGLVMTLMDRVAAMHEARSWGFKILGDIIYADTYEQAFPRAVFLLVIRDPRDQAMSLLRLNEQRVARGQQLFYSDYREAAAGWRETIATARRVIAQHRLQAIETRYEDIVTNTDHEIGRLSDALGLDLYRGLRFHQQSFVEVHTQRFQHHDNLRKAINPASVGKWRTLLSPNDLAAVRDEAGPLMQELGYA